MTNKILGIKASKSMLIDAVNPMGSVPLLATHLEKILRRYIQSPNKSCMVECHRGQPMVIEEFHSKNRSKGQVYKLTISLQEVYGYR